jgi:hypothetical protein
MSYDIENDEDVVDVQVITPSKSGHKTDYASNVFYGPPTKRNAKKVKNREEAFYKWVKGLNPDTDGIKTETTNFEYSKYTVDGKKKTNE